MKALVPLVFMLLICSTLQAQKDPNYCENYECSCPRTGISFKNTKVTGENLHTFLGPESLVNADFSNAEISSCRFDNKTLTSTCFYGAKFDQGLTDNFTSFENAKLENTCFAKALLSNVDFTNATFQNTDFTCADIQNSRFDPTGLNIIGDVEERTNFSYSKITVGNDIYSFPLNDLTTQDWASTNFNYATFYGMSEENFKPSGKDMTNALLDGIVMIGFDMTQCTLTNASLQYAYLNESTLDHSTCYGTDFTGAILDGSKINNVEFYEYQNNKSASFLAASLKNTTLNDCYLSHAVFTGANLTGTVAKRCSLEFANFEASKDYETATILKADFTLSDFTDVTMDQVHFKETYLKGSIFEGISVSNTSFTYCDLSGASFDNAVLQDVDFSSSILHNVKFTNTSLSSELNGAGVDFTCTQLGGSDFTNSYVTKANFENAVIPPTNECCLYDSNGGFTEYRCGTVISTGNIYGATTLPKLHSAVTCPNGESAICNENQWQIPNWTTTDCNLLGDNTPTILWNKPECHKVDPSNKNYINVQDKNLKKCLIETLYPTAKGKTNIERKAAATLRHLSCPDYGISSIAALDKSNFPQLTTLDLTSNNLTNGDFSYLSTLLQSLKVEDNQLTSLNFDSNQDNLTVLNASHNRITKLGSLTALPLVFLDLSYNDLSGFLPIAGFTYLFSLNLANNKLTSVGNLSNLLGAQVIYLQNNQLETIGNMSAARDSVLYNLDVSGNPCFNCESLGTGIGTISHCSCDSTNCSNNCK